MSVIATPDLNRLLRPQTIAVIGASSTSTNLANIYIQQLRAFGYVGDIYPIHLNAGIIEGEVAYASLGATPKPIDYAYVAVPAERTIDAISEGVGRLAFVQVISSGFGEVEGGHLLQQRLVDAVHAAGARLLGPNSLGVYSPAGRLTFLSGTSREAGHIGIVSQSGGLAADLLRTGTNHGLKFSSVVSIGNAADLGPADFLDHFIDDPTTKVVGMYLENIRDGQTLFERLRSLRGSLPVVILKGGTTEAGQSAATSHTGAIADDSRAWDALSKQTGVILVDTLQALIDTLVLLQHLDPKTIEPTSSVTFFGNGGGTGVLAADAASRCGLDVPPLKASATARLIALGVPAGTSLINPIDAPATSLASGGGKFAEKLVTAVLESEKPQSLIVHLNLSVLLPLVSNAHGMLSNLMEVISAAAKLHRECTHLVVVLRSDSSTEVEDEVRLLKIRAADAGIPVFATLEDAVAALARLGKFEYAVSQFAAASQDGEADGL